MGSKLEEMAIARITKDPEFVQAHNPAGVAYYMDGAREFTDAFIRRCQEKMLTADGGESPDYYAGCVLEMRSFLREMALPDDGKGEGV